MNRIDRISAILIQLQSHSLVKAQQISERFNISIRTVISLNNLRKVWMAKEYLNHYGLSSSVTQILILA